MAPGTNFNSAPVNASERATTRGATELRMSLVSAAKGWGFHEHAEKLNGRQAMLGFITLLITELAKAVKSLPAASWESVDPAARSVPAGF